MSLKMVAEIVMSSGAFVDMSWFVTANGSPVLALGLTTSIEIYIKSKGQGNDISYWKREYTAKEENLKTIFWLPSGNLFYSTCSSSKMIKFVESSFFDSVDQENGRLVDYHPKLLSHYFISERYEYVRQTLTVLYLFVKLAVESGNEFVQTPSLLWTLAGIETCKTSNSIRVEDLFYEASNESSTQLDELNHDQVHFLAENIPKLHIKNLSGSDKDTLVMLVKSFSDLNEYKNSLDSNGVRYLLPAMISLQRLAAGMQPEVTSRDACWAFFSDSQDAVQEILTKICNGKIIWKTAKALGLGWWIRNPECLKKLVEAMARNQFLANDGVKDPTACSLFYLALRKKNVLLGLWKLASSHPEHTMMVKFLMNDFENERWQNAAMKNAFALLGKQRYEYAVSFFILAGKLKDAVNVCMKQLDDPQLAIILCRVYEGEDGPVLKNLLASQLLPKAFDIQDRWMLSILLTMDKQREKAFYSVTVLYF